MISKVYIMNPKGCMHESQKMLIFQRVYMIPNVHVCMHESQRMYVWITKDLFMIRFQKYVCIIPKDV